MALFALLVISGFLTADAARTFFSNGRVSVASHKKKHHHHKHHNHYFFESLIKDFEAHPKEEPAFVKECTRIVGDLLPELREEYTERQVPFVLRHSCEVMRHKEDFRKDEHGKSYAEPVVNRAQVQCKYFATQLTKEFGGKKKYGGWCKSVFQYLTHVSIPKEEVSRLLKERNIAATNLQKVKEEWDAFRDLKGKAWFNRNKFKRHLEPWAGDGGFDSDLDLSSDKKDGASSGLKEEDSDDAESAEEEEDEDEDEATNSTDKWRKCCPKGCKVCSGFKLKKGIVRAQLFVNSDSKVINMAHQESSAEAEDTEEAADEDGEADADEDEEADADEDSDADEEGDSDQVSAEDSEEDSEEAAEEESEQKEDEAEDEEDTEDAKEAEADEDEEAEAQEEEVEETSLIQRNLRHAKKHHGNHTKSNSTKSHVKSAKKKTQKEQAVQKAVHKEKPIHLSGGLWNLINTEFERLPKTDEFLSRCHKVISKLMPDLHEEYTWKQVPFVLKHDCEVYATKTDFKTDRMKMDHAGKTCRFFAKRLADRFKTDKDYKQWCKNVYGHLLRESGSMELTDKQKKLLKETKNFGKEIYELDDACCPSNCRMC